MVFLRTSEKAGIFIFIYMIDDLVFWQFNFHFERKIL